MTVTINTGTPELLCEVRDRVATVTLNRPEKKNSLSDELTPALREILLVLETRQDVGALLLTGAGDAFCSGGDVSGMASPADSSAPKKTVDEKVAELIRKQESLTLRLYEWSKPTVAALPGGSGWSWFVHCFGLRSSGCRFLSICSHGISQYRFVWRLRVKLVSQSVTGSS